MWSENQKTIFHKHPLFFFFFGDFDDFCQLKKNKRPRLFPHNSALLPPNGISGGSRRRTKQACYHLPRTVSQEGPSAPFLCGCLKERRGENNKTTHKGSPDPGLFFSAGKRASGLILYEFNRWDEDKKSKATFPHRHWKIYKESFMANRHDAARCSESKAQTQRGPTFAVIKAAFYMFILFFRVSVKESEGAIYQAGRWHFDGKWKSFFFFFFGPELDVAACVCVSRLKLPRLRGGHYCPACQKDLPAFLP